MSFMQLPLEIEIHDFPQKDDTFENGVSTTVCHRNISGNFGFKTTCELLKKKLSPR